MELERKIVEVLQGFPNGLGAKKIAGAIEGADQASVQASVENLIQAGTLVKKGRAFKLSGKPTDDKPSESGEHDGINIPTDGTIDAESGLSDDSPDPKEPAQAKPSTEPLADPASDDPPDDDNPPPDITEAAKRNANREAVLTADYRVIARWLRNRLGRNVRVSGVAKGKVIRSFGFDLKRLLEKGWIEHV